MKLADKAMLPILETKVEITSAYKNSQNALIQFSILLLVSVLIIRLVSLAAYPLMDTTEARYAEIARMMLETGNWITPLYDYQIPFWGKPPMFAWLSAGSFSFFGVNEFAARFPHFLVSLGNLALIWLLVYKGKIILTIQLKPYAWFTVAVFASTGGFIIVSGAVMTDAALMFSVSLSMMAFWMNWHNKSRIWGYLFFLGLALGMLSKGPVAIVLVGISLTLWLSFDYRWKKLLSCLPWKGGILLFVLIALPWYLLAENATPGFLDYFLIGEHFQRFVVSGWQGDLYGQAHDKPRGMIWFLWVFASLPWGPVLIYQVFKRLAKNRNKIPIHDENNQNTIAAEHTSYLWCWMLSPLLLFSFSGNILWSYVLPGIPALALLIAHYQSERPISLKIYHFFLGVPVLLLLIVLALSMGLTSRSSEKLIIDAWKEQPEFDFIPLTYIGKRPFSAQYYSQGQAQKSRLSLVEYLKVQSDSFVVISRQTILPLFEINQYGCELRFSSQKRSLLYCSN